MRIAVLGTGLVGQALAKKLADCDHKVTIATRSVADTRTRVTQGEEYAARLNAFLIANPAVKLVELADAAQSAEMIVNALPGHAALAGLNAAGGQNLAGKILIDVSNPLDFSDGYPPSLFVSNTSSLGEEIQGAFSDAKVVKTLNTVSADLMVNPDRLADGDHTMFVSGNDPEAKHLVTDLLKHNFGWHDVIDLGDITNARGTEAALALWVRLWGKLGTTKLAFKIVR